MIKHFCDLDEEQKHFVYEVVNRTKDAAQSTTKISYEVLSAVRDEFVKFSIEKQLEFMTDGGKEYAKKVLETLHLNNEQPADKK